MKKQLVALAVAGGVLLGGLVAAAPAQAACNPSVGKTSTRDTIHHVLSRVGVSTRSAFNWNLKPGVLFALVNTPPAANYAVIEIAETLPNYVKNISRLARLNVGVVTNIGAACRQGTASYGAAGATSCPAPTTGRSSPRA